LDIRSVQKMAWENKIDKGFNTLDVPLEFCLLQGEVAEAFHAWRRQADDFGEELADVALYLVSIAEMNGIDLQTAIEQKIDKNRARRYERDETSGVMTRVDAPPPHDGTSPGPGEPGPANQ
jgi:NTP pyrophosphatase (non-canonical NTP hydrolase)